jgi:hypothetical protein
MDDGKGHWVWRKESPTGQEVTIRMEDGTEVQGHVYKPRIEDTGGEDTEGPR